MLKGPFRDPSDYPSRETAVAIVEALKVADDWTTVANIAGIEGDRYGDKTQAIAHRCYLVYGFPELEPVALARWTAEGSLRPKRLAEQPGRGTEEAREGLAGTQHPERQSAAPNTLPAVSRAHHVGYGFNRRD